MKMGFRYLSYLLFCGFCLDAFSQDTVARGKPPAPKAAYPDANLAVYENAMALHDYETAIHALHYMIATNPGGATYADTLALLYAQTGQFLSASLLAGIQLDTKGYSDMRMEVRAVAAKGLNGPVKAIEYYDILYKKTGKVSFGFEKLQLEYGIKRLQEASSTAARVLGAMPVSDSTMIQVLTLNNKSAQAIRLRAGILNIQGSVFIELNQKQDAINAFTSALGLSPGFEVAKNNLKMAVAMPGKKASR